MIEKNTTYDAPWTSNLQHRSDPNRASQRQVPASQARERQEAATQERRPPYPSPIGSSEPAYYDVSMLKRPVWKWQIATYFFLGGLSAGAYLLARAAKRTTGDRNRRLARAGTLVALGSIVPCPALLIADLGDPKRFHHMLRVFKPSSPMNLGTWMITAYSSMVAVSAAGELLGNHAKRTLETQARGTAGALLAAQDLAGIPLAIGVAGYTGVLLSCTSNPLWCKSPWLAPLFGASAISTAAEAISLSLDCTSGTSSRDERAQSALKKVDTAAHAVEAVCMRCFIRQAGEKAQPLQHGSVRKWHAFTKRALLACEVLKALPVGKRLRKPVRMLAAASGLAAGFAMRWAMIYGGKEAADDPHLARVVTRGPRR